MHHLGQLRVLFPGYLLANPMVGDVLTPKLWLQLQCVLKAVPFSNFVKMSVQISQSIRPAEKKKKNSDRFCNGDGLQHKSDLEPEEKSVSCSFRATRDPKYFSLQL